MINRDLKNIIRDILDINDYLKCDQDIVVFRSFMQTWGSTALGFNTIGGQAMTSRVTTVIKTNDCKYYVFFGGRLAYCIEEPSEEFFKDLIDCHMVDCATAMKRY